MEQKDYLLREIEKIGAVLRAILNRLTGSKGNFATTVESVFEKTNEELVHKINFDLTCFLALDESASLDYISRFEGMSSINLELLAEIIYQIAIQGSAGQKRIFLEKAIFLYEFCETTDKTFSFEREQRIKEIRKAL